MRSGEPVASCPGQGLGLPGPPTPGPSIITKFGLKRLPVTACGTAGSPRYPAGASGVSHFSSGPTWPPKSSPHAPAVAPSPCTPMPVVACAAVGSARASASAAATATRPPGAVARGGR